MSYGYSSPNQFTYGYAPDVSITDLVLPHMKNYVHPHWAKFPPVNPMWHYLLAVIYIILGTASIFGKNKIFFNTYFSFMLRIKFPRMWISLLTANKNRCKFVRSCLFIAGNGLVMYLFLKSKFLRTPSNLLVANLALTDFVMLITQFPFFVYNCLSGGQWMFSPFMCELYAFFGERQNFKISFSNC